MKVLGESKVLRGLLPCWGTVNNANEIDHENESHAAVGTWDADGLCYFNLLHNSLY